MHFGKAIAVNGAAGAAIALAAPALAQEARVRVVDVGAGLCVVAVVPGGHAMLYDAGRGQPLCRQAVQELVPGGRLDLVVLSHSDADHIRELPAILEDVDAAVIVHTGDPRGPLLDPIRRSIEAEGTRGAEIWNLSQRPVPIGHKFPVGAATATFIASNSSERHTRWYYRAGRCRRFPG